MLKGPAAAAVATRKEAVESEECNGDKDKEEEEEEKEADGGDEPMPGPNPGTALGVATTSSSSPPPPPPLPCPLKDEEGKDEAEDLLDALFLSPCAPPPYPCPSPSWPCLLQPHTATRPSRSTATECARDAATAATSRLDCPAPPPPDPDPCLLLLLLLLLPPRLPLEAAMPFAKSTRHGDNLDAAPLPSPKLALRFLSSPPFPLPRPLPPPPPPPPPPLLWLLVPSPSCPKRSLPQAYTAPRSVTTKLWFSPAAQHTATFRLPKAAAAADDDDDDDDDADDDDADDGPNLSMGVGAIRTCSSPCPSRPPRPCPQLKQRPSAVTAKVWNLPADTATTEQCASPKIRRGRSP